MRFLFVVPPLTGHVNPTISVARALETRGHEVAWVGHPGKVRPLLPAGAKLFTLPEDATADHAQRVQDKAATTRGAAALKFLWEDFLVPLARSMKPGIAAAVDEFAPDVMCCDQQAVAGGLVARTRNLKWATLATTSAGISDPLAALPQVKKWFEDLIYGLEREAGLPRAGELSSTSAPPAAVLRPGPSPELSPTSAPPAAVLRPGPSPELSPTSAPPAAALRPGPSPELSPTSAPPTAALRPGPSPELSPTSAPPAAVLRPGPSPELSPTSAPPAAALRPGPSPELSPHLVIAFTTSALVPGDFPAHYKLVGPSIADRPETTPFPFDQLRRPCVLVSMGTVNAELSGRFYAVVTEALADQPYQVVLVAPPELVPEVPANFIHQRYVPQLALLSHVDAVLCHGGHNTTCEALAHGLPLAIAPIKDDQPIVADQVVAAGAGVRLKFGRVQAPELRDAVARVLADPALRAGAARVRDSFIAAGGAPKAAEHLEALGAKS